MDYDAVRAAADGSTNMRRVEVNQRALIDKILARYATASAVYRELLQNSNDASATVRWRSFSFRCFSFRFFCSFVWAGVLCTNRTSVKNADASSHLYWWCSISMVNWP
jgi:hypothetical protein